MRAVKISRVERSTFWSRVQKLLHLFHGVSAGGIVREILSLLVIVLMIVKLHALLAAVPFGVAISIGADRAPRHAHARRLRAIHLRERCGVHGRTWIFEHRPQ